MESKEEAINLMNDHESNDNALKELFDVIWQGRWNLIGLSSIFFIGGIIYSLLATELWTSSSLVKVVAAADFKGGTRKIGSQADLGSISLESKVGLGKDGPSRSDIFLATINSRDFVKHIIGFEGILPKLMATKSYDKKTNSIVFNSTAYNSEDGWVNGLPPFFEIHKKFKSVFKAYTNSRTGLITLTVTHQSPDFALEFLELIIQQINANSREKDLSYSDLTLDYLYSELDIATQGDIKLSINQLIEAQLKQKMLARVKQNHFIEPLDLPFMPEQRTSPRRTLTVILSTLIGMVLGFAGNLIYFYGFKKAS